MARDIHQADRGRTSGVPGAARLPRRAAARDRARCGHPGAGPAAGVFADEPRLQKFDDLNPSADPPRTGGPVWRDEFADHPDPGRARRIYGSSAAEWPGLTAG